MKGIAFVGTKGGVGKTTLSHLLALGAAWKGVPAYLMHTDNRPPIKVNGRPYMFYDARKPETLSTLIGAAMNQDGYCIIDSGGNRPDFDKWIASSVDLVLIPVIPDEEAVYLALKHMETLKSYGSSPVRFVINEYSSNRLEREADFREYYSRLPEELVIGQVKKVNAVKRLRKPDHDVFPTPPSNVNNLSRNFYFMIKVALEELKAEQLEALQQTA
jgi:cellulose biosynthesis protein BcsQ